MRYALIGCGRIARRHIPAALAAELDIVALCDLDVRRAARIAADIPGERALPTYSDYRALLEQERPDLVAIATDSGSHAAIALHCLEQGIPVIIEKPMVLGSEDADRICRLSFEMGLPVAVCHQNRFNPAVAALRTALDTGALGEPYYAAAAVRWHRGEDYYAQADWRGKWRTDGGVLMNQCIHAADMLIHLLGAPKWVSGHIARRARPIEAEDFGAALIGFAGGRTAIFEGTALIEPGNLEETLFVAGSGGTARLAFELILAIYRSAKAGGGPVGFMEAPFDTTQMTGFFGKK